METAAVSIPKSTKTNKKSSQPNLIWKAEMSYIHSIFKLESATMKKNTSYKLYEPIIEDVEHAHFFHNKNRRGKDNDYCAAVGGHFHKMITYDEKGQLIVDENGHPSPKCGPALRKVVEKLKSGRQRSKIEEVEWFHEDQDKKIIDNHIHKIVYRGSEELNDSKIKQIQKSNAQGVSNMIGTKDEPSGSDQ